LPSHVLFFIVSLTLWGLFRYVFEVGRLLQILVLWVGPFMLILDLANIIYCRLRIARIRRNESPRRAS